MPMDSRDIEALSNELVQLAVPSLPAIERIVGVTFAKVKENQYYEFYVGIGPDPQLADLDLRIKKDGSGKALLVLNIAEEAQLVEDALALDRFGIEPRLDVNAEIPPEGTVALTYSLDSAEIRFQFTATSRTLRLIAIEWGLNS